MTLLSRQSIGFALIYYFIAGTILCVGLFDTIPGVVR